MAEIGIGFDSIDGFDGSDGFACAACFVDFVHCASSRQLSPARPERRQAGGRTAMPASINMESDPSDNASMGWSLSPVRSFGQPCQPLLHPRHSAAIKSVPWLWRHGPPVPEFRHPVAKLNPCPTNAPAPATFIDLESVQPQTSKAIDDASVAVARASTSKRFRRRRLRGPVTSPTTRRGMRPMGPNTGPRRHGHRRSCRWATLNRRRRTHGLGPSTHPRATACRSFTGVVRRQPVLGQARWTDRGRDGPDASSGALYPSVRQLSELRIIGDKAADARKLSSSRCGRGPLDRWWSEYPRRSDVRELAPRRAQGGA